MNTYQVVKTLHILSAVLLAGTGFGTAFYLFVTNRSDCVPAQAVITRWVCKADWWFTTPAVIFQPLSGLWMAKQTYTPLTAPWIAWTIVLFLFAGVCWLPVVWWQLQMRDIANESAKNGDTLLPARYWQLASRWELAGYPAFSAVVVIFFLMVMKPM